MTGLFYVNGGSIKLYSWVNFDQSKLTKGLTILMKISVKIDRVSVSSTNL